jgi:hypothetical protein
VLLDHVGEHVIPAFPDGREAHVRRDGERAPGAGGQVTQERPAEAVAVENAMPGGAPDAARLPPVQERNGPGPGHHAMVDLIAADGLAQGTPDRTA